MLLLNCGASSTDDRGDRSPGPDDGPVAEPDERTVPADEPAGEAFELLGVSVNKPKGFTKVQEDELSLVYRQGDTQEIRIAYDFSVTRASIEAEASKPLVFDQTSGATLDPQGSPEAVDGHGLLQTYRGTANGRQIYATIAGVPRSGGDPGGVLIAGFSLDENAAKSIHDQVKHLSRTVAFGPMTQDEKTIAYLSQGQWHHEDFHYSPGGVGTGSSSNHSYYCFQNGRFQHSSQSHISVDVSGGSAAGEGAGTERGRFYVFGNGAEAWVVMVDDADTTVSTLKIKLIPASQAFKVGEKTFYELTGRSCASI